MLANDTQEKIIEYAGVRGDIKDKLVVVEDKKQKVNKKRKQHGEDDDIYQDSDYEDEYKMYYWQPKRMQNDVMVEAQTKKESAKSGIGSKN